MFTQRELLSGVAKKIDTVERIVELVGGPTAAARLTGVTIPAVWNWKDRGFIPAVHFLAFSAEARRRGREVDPAIFAFKAAEARA